MPALPHGLLTCPVCGLNLQVADRTLACDAGHSFDAARQGYYNLLTGKGSSFVGDTPEMVEAREQFLASGAYAPLRDLIVESGLGHVRDPATVLDAGAGTGYYLEGFTSRVPGLFPLALDISRPALRRAARRLPSGVSIIWDLWKPLPVSDGSVDVLLNVFAPRNPAEFTRILSERGCAVVVTPRPGHLGELETLGPMLAVPPQKADDVRRSFDGVLVEAAREDLDYVMPLPVGLARQALVMGPAAHHRTGADTGPDRGDTLAVEAKFTVQVFTR